MVGSTWWVCHLEDITVTKIDIVKLWTKDIKNKYINDLLFVYIIKVFSPFMNIPAWVLKLHNNFVCCHTLPKK